MTPRLLLRLEGLVVFVLATAAFFSIRSEPLLYVVLVVAPDLSMVGYLSGTAIGSRIYNLFHTYTAPLLLTVAGIWLDRTLLIQAGMAWTAHIGIDRALQYGLKYETGFQDTHMQNV